MQIRVVALGGADDTGLETGPDGASSLSKIVTAPRAPAPSGIRVDSPLGVYASRALWATGIIYFVGTLVDLGILWIIQRQAGVQWEFVALTNTVEAWPQLILSVALCYAGFALAGSESLGLQRTLAAVSLLLGIGGVVFGALETLNYLTLAASASGTGTNLILSAFVKTMILCGLYVLLFIPLGILGFKRPRV